MPMTEKDTYDVDEEQEISAIIFNKEFYTAHGEGLNDEDARKYAQQKSNEARRKHALLFLNKLEKKLSELSNQEVADLLRALIASGLPIETEEELEFWIRKLERESLHRIAVYFVLRNDNNAKSSRHKRKFQKNFEDFTADDIAALASMMTSINQIFLRKAPKDKNSEEYKRFLERKKFFKRVEKILQQDAQKRKKEEKQLQNIPRNKREEVDYLSLLKEKMLREDVLRGGKYWNAVIDDFSVAPDKAEFVSLWQKDEMRQLALDFPDKNMQEQIQKLRGIDNFQERTAQDTNSSQNKQKSDQSNANQNNAAQQAAQANANASAGR